LPSAAHVVTDIAICSTCSDCYCHLQHM